VLDNSIYQVVDTAQIGYYRPNNLIGIENILNFNFDNTITLISGLTFEFEQLSETPSYSYSVSSAVKPPIPTKPGMLSNRLISIFMEPRIVLLENIFLSGGVRFDNSSTYNQVLTPKIGASYLFDKHIFRLSYAEAFRAPKPWDYTDGISNYNLKPEKLSAMEASINLILTQYFNFNLSVYNSIHKNGLVKETLSNGWRWVNREITNTTGTEMMLIYREKRIKTSFSYTFTQSKNEFGNFIPEISKHTANAGITYLLNRYFTLNLRANYIGKRSNPVFITSTGTNIVDPALIFNCAVSLINYNGFSGQIVINNLLNSEYYHTSNRDPERYRQPQRTIIFSIGFAVDS
jgi:outer membrane cobalamin receptor